MRTVFKMFVLYLADLIASIILIPYYFLYKCFIMDNKEFEKEIRKILGNDKKKTLTR